MTPSVDPQAAAGADGPGGDELSEGTARQSERVAVLVAAGAAALLALEVAAPLAGLVALAGAATALGLQYATARRTFLAVSARSLGVLGLLGGGAGAVTIAATGEPGSWYGPLGVGLGAWLAVVGTVGAVLGGGALERVRALASTLVATGALTAVGLVTGASALLTGSSLGSGAASLVPYVVRGLVYGGRPTSALPILVFLAAMLCAALLVGLSVTPLHVLLSPRTEQSDVEALESFTTLLVAAAVGGSFAALFLYVTGFTPAFGPLAPLEHALRALLGLAIAGILLATAVVPILPHGFGSGDRSVRGTVATLLAGGSVAAICLTVVGAVATDGSIATGTASSIPASWTLWIVVALGILAIPVLLALQAVSRLSSLVPERTQLLAPGGLLIASIGAAHAGAVASVVLGVAATLLLWDALAYRNGLRSEVSGAGTAAVERRHLGATTGLLLVGVAAALALYGVTALVGPVLGGQPLVVVVVGATLLAAVALVLGQSRPAS